MAEIDDPFNRPDGTVLRPRPGAGRRGGGEAGRARPPAAADWDQIPASLQGNLGFGLNPLVQAASPLLLLAGRLRGSLSPLDVAGLRRHALEEVRRFEDQARESGVQNDMVMAARYALCAGLDEAVLSTPWGGQSEWAQNPLLVALHREAWGGEKFFDVLDRVSREPAKYIDLMELQYLCLAFGFAGKYQVKDRGHEQLADVQQTLYRRIRNHRTPPDPELSLRWRGLEDRRNPVIRYVPFWVVAAAALAIAAVTFTVYYTSLARSAEPIQVRLANVGREGFTQPAAPAPAKGPTLKQLLAADERAGVLRVEEQGGRTVVTMLAAGLFASGSATVNAGVVGTLEHIAGAIAQVPGRVLVVGHTDDQPVRSLRFQDNFELSRERAVSVAQVLLKAPANAGRVSWTGVGSSEPLARPESLPENRARNRRVEIVHVRGT
jgi:type VI secretion system protein ImpK